MNAVWVALGAAAGGVLRYAVALWVPWKGGFPWATWSVNVLGTFVLGALSGFLVKHVPAGGEALRCFAIVGLCGGFTTFSTFSNELFRMLEGAQWGLAALYAMASLLTGLLAVSLGYFLMR